MSRLADKPVVIEWYVVGFVGTSNVYCRQCENGYQALEVFTQVRHSSPDWRVAVRRVVRVEG